MQRRPRSFPFQGQDETAGETTFLVAPLIQMTRPQPDEQDIALRCDRVTEGVHIKDGKFILRVEQTSNDR